MAEEEDLNVNPLFEYLQGGNVLEQAAAKNYLVLIPAAASLALCTINREFATTHILARPKPDAADPTAHATVSGKIVHLRDRAFTTGAGFPTPARVCAVASEETYYTESFASFQLMRLTLPLLGKVSPAYMQSISAQPLSSTPVDRRTPAEHEAVLRKALPAAAADLAAFRARFAAEFLTSYVMVRGFEGQTGDKVRSACAKAVADAVAKQRAAPASSSSGPSAAAAAQQGQAAPGVFSAATLAELEVALDACVLSDIGGKVLGTIREFYARADASLTALGATAQVLRLPELLALLGLRPALRPDLTAALEAFEGVLPEQDAH